MALFHSSQPDMGCDGFHCLDVPGPAGVISSVLTTISSFPCFLGHVEQLNLTAPLNSGVAMRLCPVGCEEKDYTSVSGRSIFSRSLSTNFICSVASITYAKEIHCMWVTFEDKMMSNDNQILGFTLYIASGLTYWAYSFRTS